MQSPVGVRPPIPPVYPAGCGPLVCLTVVMIVVRVRASQFVSSTNVVETTKRNLATAAAAAAAAATAPYIRVTATHQAHQ